MLDALKQNDHIQSIQRTFESRLLARTLFVADVHITRRIAADKHSRQMWHDSRVADQLLRFCCDLIAT